MKRYLKLKLAYYLHHRRLYNLLESLIKGDKYLELVFHTGCPHCLNRGSFPIFTNRDNFGMSIRKCAGCGHLYDKMAENPFKP